jgi:DtxR family Mn-dependent transcriptional regulator
LEILWTQNEKEGESELNHDDSRIIGLEDAIEELERNDLIERSKSLVSLKDKGLIESRKVIRRTRLAERLLSDVLDTDPSMLEEVACKFEHILKKGIEENICILLGHPRICPHGDSIPEGKCCPNDYGTTGKIVIALSNMKPNEEGKIAYIHTKREKRIQKLMAMGVTPGKTISIIQDFPSIVFQVGQTQIAVDKEIGNEVFVIKTGPQL